MQWSPTRQTPQSFAPLHLLWPLWLFLWLARALWPNITNGGHDGPQTKGSSVLCCASEIGPRMDKVKLIKERTSFTVGEAGGCVGRPTDLLMAKLGMMIRMTLLDT